VHDPLHILYGLRCNGLSAFISVQDVPMIRTGLEILWTWKVGM
jgi:hypothetical protein